MWCPNCKNEYIKGLTKCSDCGADLVDALPHIPPAASAAVSEPEASCSDEEYDPPSADGVSGSAFVEAKIKLEDVRSTAYTFTLFGVIGLLVDILVLSNVLDLQITGYMRYIMSFVLCAMFLVFIYIGIRSFRQMKLLALMAEEEQTRTDSIVCQFLSECSCSDIDENAGIHATDMAEQIYFKRYDIMKKHILEIAPESSHAYADYVSDLLYTRMFPES